MLNVKNNNIDMHICNNFSQLEYSPQHDKL